MGQHKDRWTRQGCGDPEGKRQECWRRGWSPDERRDEQKELLRSLIFDSARRMEKTEQELKRLAWNLHSRGDKYEETLLELLRERDARNDSEKC